MDSDDKKMKIDWFKLKKIVLDTVRGVQLLYISLKFDYKYNSWLLQCFSLRVSFPFYTIFPFHLHLPRANQIVGVDLYPISTFLKSLGSSCKAESYYSGWKLLFRYHFLINAARELAAEHLIQW